MEKQLFNNKILILNMCSPYDQLYSRKVFSLLDKYSHIHILTDNKNIIQPANCVTFTYCKSGLSKQTFHRSQISEEIYEAIKFDRYCSYYPRTLYLPKFIAEKIKTMTISVLVKLEADLNELINSTDKIFYVSEPPASAIGVYMDIFLRKRRVKPFYYTSSRVFPGRCIVTQRNDGDAGAISFVDRVEVNLEPFRLNSKLSNNARTSLSQKTNRNLFQKLNRFLSKSNLRPQSIYPATFFRVLLAWRHFVHRSRALVLEKCMVKYSIREIRNLFPGCRISVVFLHFEPEVSTLYWMRSVGNQIEWIKSIASRDSQTIFLIREHIHFKGYRMIQDYYQLLNISNIKILKNEDSQLVIEEADEILSYSGSIGFECLKSGKFNKFKYSGQPFYHDLLDETGQKLSQQKFLEYQKKTVNFEPDPAMDSFSTAENKVDFVYLLQNLVNFPHNYSDSYSDEV
jgi:hypothetical protein